MESRISYVERLLLDCGLLTGSQRYHRAQQQSHQSTAHSPGVVLGLTLEIAARNRLRVEPGIGVDPAGRLLVLPEPLDQPLTAEDDGSAIWLTQKTRGSSNRWLDGVALRLAAPGDDQTELGAALCLGQIVSEGQGSFRATSAGRCISGARGAQVRHPAGPTRLVLANAGDGPAALCLRDDLRKLLELTRTHGLRVAGSLRLGPGGRLDMGALEFRAPEDPASRPAAPWSISLRPADPKPEKTGPLAATCTLGSGKTMPSCLRIGYRDAQGAFRTQLAVRADGSVQVPGDLLLKGGLRESPVAADTADSRFMKLLGAAWASPTKNRPAPSGEGT